MAEGTTGARRRPSLAQIFGKGGPLSRVLPGYEPRAVQLAMAEDVENALARGRALVVEAGTGTGKTLAYLVPAARSGLKIVVSTATKALQEQIAEKEVPLLAALGIDARVAFLKGRQNYLCLLRKERFDQSPSFITRADEPLYRELDRWALRTETGDRAELVELPESFPAWREVSSTTDTCTGQKCPHYDRCFVFKMRRRAAEADVVVVNHHLFFADLALRSSPAGDAGASVLPRYDAVIFDEAHAIEEVATDHFGVLLSSHRVAELARDAQRALQARPGRARARDLAARLLREGGAFFAAALACRGSDLPSGSGSGSRSGSGSGLRSGSSSGSGSRSGSQGAAEEGSRWALPPGSLAPAEPARRALAELLRALGAALSSEGEVDDELSLLERRCLAFGADLALFAPEAAARADVEYDDGYAPAPDSSALFQWAEARSGHLFLHASPVDVAGLLQALLYERVGPVVFTSATLSVGGSLDYFSHRVGLKDASGPVFATDEAVLASPFDYERNAALYLPAGMPDPQDERFARAVADELRALLPITGGRAFVLFTSLRNMRAVHALLARELPWQVLLQGEREKAQLLRDFRERPSVLFASQSFWEGIDVPGKALSLVVIDKLPFASPGEPLVQARIERLRAGGEEPFRSYQLPQAALALKQGFGRLIRTATDRGVVAILDPRVTGKGYGQVFLKTLPRCPILRSSADVERFWRSGGPGAG